MPIILAVNGIVETYPIKPVGPRNGRAESAGEREHHGRHSPSLDRSALAAQTAYQQQSSERPHLKPAILARDLMSAPVSLFHPTAPCWTPGRVCHTKDSIISL